MKNNLLVLTLLGFVSNAFGGENSIDITAGYFNLNARTSEKKVTVSSPSLFRFAYGRSVYRNINLSLGYTILMSDFSGSDLGYGLDLGANYYFLSTPNDNEFSNESIKISRSHLYKPYVGLSFSQRQFQSTKNSYAGPGVNFGIERRLSRTLGIKSEMRHTELSGSGGAKASETNFLLGISFKY